VFESEPEGGWNVLVLEEERRVPEGNQTERSLPLRKREKIQEMLHDED